MWLLDILSEFLFTSELWTSRRGCSFLLMIFAIGVICLGIWLGRISLTVGISAIVGALLLWIIVAFLLPERRE